MANEISMTVKLEATKDEMTAKLNRANTRTMAGDQMISNVQNVGTSAEQIVFGDVAAPYRVAIHNKDTTNYVEIALDNGITQIVSTLQAGEECLLNRPPLTLYAKANTAACNLNVVAVEV